MSKKLADSIISLRRKHGFSQEQLAEKIGVTRQAISNWERGTAAPDVETLNLIAKLFDTDLLAIINGESNEQEKAKDTIPHRTALLIAIIVLMIVHFLLAFLNKIEMIQVVLVPGVLVVLSVLIHFIFRHVTAQNDFSIIAGFDKKKDNVETVKKTTCYNRLAQSCCCAFYQCFVFCNVYRAEGRVPYWQFDLSEYIFHHDHNYHCRREPEN